MTARVDEIGFFFLMIRRPPRSTLDRASAASDVYKRQAALRLGLVAGLEAQPEGHVLGHRLVREQGVALEAVSYTHLRAHETVLDLVCRLLLETKKYNTHTTVR